MPWFARRLMNVNGRMYGPGEELPADEVESWTNLQAYVNRGWVSGTHEEAVKMAGTHDPVESSDPATEGARATFPKEWPAPDKPPTTEPVSDAAASPYQPGPPGDETPMAVAPEHVDEVAADVKREDAATAPVDDAKAPPAETQTVPKQNVERSSQSKRS